MILPIRRKRLPGRHLTFIAFYSSRHVRGHLSLILHLSVYHLIHKEIPYNRSKLKLTSMNSSNLRV